jgi:hypothetical protein
LIVETVGFETFGEDSVSCVVETSHLNVPPARFEVYVADVAYPAGFSPLKNHSSAGPLICSGARLLELDELE